MRKIKKNDTVILIAGKDKGKSGQILSILKDKRVIVSGLNMAKKHVKPNPNKDEKGGIIAKEMPVHISNIAIFNQTSNKADKVKIKLLEDGKKVRTFKSSGEVISV
jgi:large subunit ribosomal protein L24